jgi:hypothetical protein
MTGEVTTLSEDLRAALQRVADALAAMGAGDPAPYAALWAPGHDVTLFGAWGPVERGHEAVTRTFEWVGGRISDDTLVPRNDVLRRLDGTWYLVHRHADFPPRDRRRP